MDSYSSRLQLCFGHSNTSTSLLRVLNEVGQRKNGSAFVCLEVHSMEVNGVEILKITFSYRAKVVMITLDDSMLHIDVPSSDIEYEHSFSSLKSKSKMEHFNDCGEFLRDFIQEIRPDEETKKLVVDAIMILCDNIDKLGN